MDGRGQSLEISTSIWLAGVAGIVLLIACANVAGLLGVRAIYQQRTTAVRLALGATRARLIVHFLAESTLIAALGGAAGLAIAWVGGHVVRSVLIPDVAWSGPPFNTRILLFTATATLLTGIATGLAPALSATDISLVKWLRDGARDGGSSRHRLGAVLLAGQTALSVVLLAGAALFLRSLFNVQRIDLGMDASRLIVVQSDAGSDLYRDSELDALLRTASERLRRLAGIQSVSLAVNAPFRSLTGGGFEIPGRDTLPRLESGGPYRNDVSPGFFSTLGSSFVAGRGFTPSEPRRPEVVVNETLARAYWPNRNPVGSCVYLHDSETCAELVGVVRDITQWRLVGEIPVGQVYTPLAALSDSGASMARRMFIRTAGGDPGPVIQAVRRELVALSPELAYMTVTDMRTMIAPQLRPWQLGATMLAVFGTLALLIAAIGLYSALAYAVARRTHEIGIRMALGAAAPTVTRLIVWSGLRTVLVGIGVGLAVVLLAGEIIAGSVYGVSPRDPLALTMAMAVFTLVALIASAIPAWRASSVDPAGALRNSE
jgi:predicted permease